MPASGNLPQRLLRLASSGHQPQKTAGSATVSSTYYPASAQPASGLDTLFHMIRRKMVCSRKRIYRLMQQLHIQSARKFAYKRTTNSRHSHPVAANLLNRNFQVDKPNTVWVGDITYIPTGQGWLYQGRHRTKHAWRLCTASADEFSVISHKNSLKYDSIPASFLCNLMKNLLAHLLHNLCVVSPWQS